MLFASDPVLNSVMRKPLADLLRPNTWEDVVGQRHLVGENGLLTGFLSRGALPSLIFHGPPGVGKTTVAELVAKEVGKPIYRLNATTASLADLKAVFADVGTLMAPDGLILYLDEIQYFNKKQQQSLLPYMENGSVTLIASTTENPYFAIYSAILSRSMVFSFSPLDEVALEQGLVRAKEHFEAELGVTLRLEDGVSEHILRCSGGDLRRVLSGFEALVLGTAPVDGIITLDVSRTAAIFPRAALSYDRDGDAHYDILSGFQKSIRGSDPDAALHYLARLIEAGDLASPMRRLLVIAAEDVGLAYPQAMVIVKACVDAAHMLGLPEARIPLAEAVVLLATAPKSNSCYVAIEEALTDLRQRGAGEVPAHLRDSHYAGASKLGHGSGYRYPHAYPHHYVAQDYLPNHLADAIYYEYGENKAEQSAAAYWRARKGEGHGTGTV